MKSRITKILISSGLVFILCSCFYGIEELSQDNAEYLLTKYHSLIYIYNQTDTSKVSIENYFSKGSIDYYYGFRSVTDDSGESRFYLPDSIYQVSLSLHGRIDVIVIRFILLDKKSIYYGRSEKMFYHDIKKSELTDNRTVLNKEYTNCFIYDSNTSLYSNDAGIQSFVYNKEYGLVQLIMKDSTRFELIGAK